MKGAVSPLPPGYAYDGPGRQKAYISPGEYDKLQGRYKPYIGPICLIKEAETCGSLELNQLNKGSWETVEVPERMGDSALKYPVICMVSFDGNTFLGSTVTIVPARTVFEQREAWLEQIRAHIAPWNLLEQRVRALPENIRQHILKAS